MAFDSEDAPASAFELLGLAFFHCSAFNDALNAYTAAHAVDPQSFWINYWLAMLYRGALPPRPEEAQWHVDKALLAFPGRRFGIEAPRPPGPPRGPRRRR